MISLIPPVQNKNIVFKNNVKDNTENSKGYLVNESPIQSVQSTVKEYAKMVKYTVDAAQGKGDDYSVGKINDLTLRLGGLGIAAVLSSMIKNPSSKVMEFAGFASFFAAMSIWPKLFIAEPLKAKTGFDVNQQYVDSYGRRKRFFEDPQYLAWDLWSSEEINKIGDKLKIPQNIENREKHIKEKMQQIATQSNTLWMLTAGLSTPLMASLMGNYISKYVGNIVETSRTKSALKTAGLNDFTPKSQNILEKIFVNPIANLITLTKKKADLDNQEDMLKKLDDAYDAIFGKSDDAEYEFNKGRLLYSGVSDDKMLTQYDSKSGNIIVQDIHGNILQKIKTKNIDGISIFGNKWQEIPNKLTEALNITPEKYKKLITESLKVAEDGSPRSEAEILSDILIKEFGGNENKSKLKKAFISMEKILTSSIKELDESKTIFENKLNEIKLNYEHLLENNNLSQNEKAIINEKIKFIINVQKDRLTNKVVNTKSSWFAPVRILDIIAQHSDEASADVAKSKELKDLLRQFIYGVTPHHINNNFNDIIKGDYSEMYRYTLGIDKFFSPLSDKTKEIFSQDNIFIKNIDDNTNWLWNKFYNVANQKGNYFEAICEWLGKTPYEFIEDSAKQTGIYKGWLKKVGIAFTLLTATTWVALSQFGKTNKLNPDIYRYKDKNLGGQYADSK